MEKAIKKRTHEEYINELAIKNPTVIAIDKYIDANTKILHKCLIHNQTWMTTPTRALKGVGCELCHNERVSMNKTRSHEWYLNEISKVAPNIRVIGKYQKSSTPIKHYCTLHDIEWDASPDSILNGHGCWFCGLDKISAKNTKSYDQYVNELREYDPNIICIGNYVNMTTKVKHKCLIDGYEWDAMPTWLLGGRGCPKCHESHGERQIRNWLEAHNIQYITQMKFEDCKAARLLPFDFYLPNNNIAIEFDGEQHFRSVDFFAGESALIKRKKYDKIKDIYCKINNITLLRIPYFKNIETELNNYILTQ